MSKWYSELLKVLILLSILTAQPAMALNVHSDMNYQSVAAHLRVYIDTDHRETIDSITTVQASKKFVSLGDGVITLGFTPATHWFYLPLSNHSAQPAHVYLSLKSPLLDSLDIFVINENKSQQHSLGDLQPYHKRLINSPDYLIPLKVAPSSEMRLYIKARTAGMLRIPFAIAGEKNSFSHQLTVERLKLLIFGLILGIIVYNLILFFINRDPAFLYFVLAVSSTLMARLCLDGYGFSLWPNAIAWQQIAIFVLTYVNYAFGVLFIWQYLRLHEYSPRLSRLGIGLFSLGILLTGVSVVIPQNINSILVFGFLVLTCTYLLVTATVRWRQGYRPALMLVIGWSISIVAVALLSTSNIDIGSTPFQIILGHLPNLLMILFLSVALAFRLNFERKAQAIMEKQIDKAQIESQTKSDFLAKMSHEIRTPMNGVMGMTELLNATELTATQSRYVGVIHKSGLTLLTVINDILDYSKLAAGKLSVENISYSSKQLIEDVEGVLSLHAEEKQINLVCRLDPEFPQQISIDPSRLRQVLINLLSNALKFTEHGDVYLSLGYNNPDKDQLRLSIRDTGIGLSEYEQKDLFKSFSQANITTSRVFGGTGLGLAICKQIIGLMAGEIGCESRKDKGSTFWFTVPLQPTACPLGKISNDLEAKKIVLIDACENRRLATMEQLLYAGADLTPFSQTALALTDLISQKTSADIIFIDTGFDNQCCSKVIEYAQAHDIHCVIFAGELQIVKLRGLYPDQLILKRPAIAGHFEPLLPIFLNHPRSAEDNAVERLQSGQSLAQHQQLRINKSLSVLIAEDNSINQMVLSGMLEKLGHQITITNNGQQVLTRYTQNAENFDMILMDCEMPIMDGYRACEKIRHWEAGAGRHITIIALTAHAMAEHRVKCDKAGMDGFLSKPVQLQQINEICKQAAADATSEASGQANQTQGP